MTPSLPRATQIGSRQVVALPGQFAERVVAACRAYMNTYDVLAVEVREHMQVNMADALRASDAVLAASPLPSSSGTGWRPIETAPKDGTRFLAYTDDGVDFFHWQDHQREGSPVGWRDSFIRVYRENDPTGPEGWMPLPSAPVSDGGEHG